MEEITNKDLMVAIKELLTNQKEFEKRMDSLENDIKEMKTELKHDIKKVDKKVGTLSAELLDAKADIVMLQQEIN